MLIIVLFAGVMVETAKGHVRSFAMNKLDFDQLTLRTNQRHDDLLVLKQHHQQQILTFRNQPKQNKKIMEEHFKTAEKGILVRCILRSLFVFDVGMSFMADSLHNVYRGAFVSRIV
jgi:hypothetical protein